MKAADADRLNVTVVFPRPRGGPYTYRIPKGLEHTVEPGMRVVAPLGKRALTGVVFATGVCAPEGIKLKTLKEIIDERPLLPGDLLELARWISRYYFCDLGEALRAIVPGVFLRVGDLRIRLKKAPENSLPKLTPLQKKILAHLEEEKYTLLSRLKRVLKTKHLSPHLACLSQLNLIELEDHLPRLPRARMRSMVEALSQPPAEELEKLLARKSRQRQCYELLKGMAHPVEMSLLTNQLGFSPSIVRALVAKGLVKKFQVEDVRDPFRDIEFPPYQAPEPSPVQQKVIESIRSCLGAHKVFLLHGVTGSGKTLVYLQLLGPVLEAGCQAIVLVPEISLTPQTTGRFRAVFGERVAVLHSGLSPGERYDIWRQIRRGRFSVVVGPRSAVFAPFENLGIIIIDEEQEHTYKQSDTTPCYHAREVAAWRMQRAGGPLVLGSATPSLESYYKARKGEYHLLELPERAQGLPLPRVRIHDLRKGWVKKGGTLLTETLLNEIRFALEAGGQVLLLLNRRGFNNFLLCEECGHVPGCENCQISLTLHRRLNRLLCHYCGWQQDIPQGCPACNSPRLTPMGAGTEQMESLLKTHFPARVIDRMDMDTTGGKWSHHEILERLRTGATDILVGTQMIAKGLDFPNVILVGVANADTAMNLPNFRATEQTFQLLAQVAGRAGRSRLGGEVLVQTFRPEHPAIKAAINHDYSLFAKQELAVRREAQYPPYVQLLNVVFSGKDEKMVESFAQHTASSITEAAEAGKLTGKFTLLGPAPCPLEKLRGRYRWHLILKSAKGDVLGEIGSFLIREIKPPGKGDCRMMLDRDPVSLM